MCDFEVNDHLNPRMPGYVWLEMQLRLAIELPIDARSQQERAARYDQHHVEAHDVAAARRPAVDAVRPAIPVGPAPASNEELAK